MITTKHWYILIFSLLNIFFFSCSENVPVITRLEPPIGYMGDLLTIHGSGFGNERNESFITIAGSPPTSSSYISWTDNEINVYTPEFGNAGLVYVHRGVNRSNPALFSNLLNFPTSSELQSGGVPVITSITPVSGPIGSLVTINGNYFGSSRNNGGVYFSWVAEQSPAVSGSTFFQDYMKVPDSEFAYALWSEREIHVRVPDGAINGTLEVRTDRGVSRSVNFEVTGRPGTKSFSNRQSYTVSYTADMRIAVAENPNALYIWMPVPVTSASQNNVNLLNRNIEPFVENYNGTSLFQFINVIPLSNHQISLSYQVDVYTVETNIRSQALPRLNSPAPVNDLYTQPTPLVNSGDEDIRSRATQLSSRETLPLVKAQRIYEWLISSYEVSSGSYDAALLFCALLRAAGVPAIPVSGVLVDEEMNTTVHFWAEFWLDGFGWVPADPVLGAGFAPPSFLLREDNAGYYFGNLDNQRVTFSRGEHGLLHLSPQERTVTRNREFSLQNIWEEAAGELGSYTSRWSNVIVTKE